MLPVLTMLALDMGTALTAAIYVESVYGMPGLGYLAVNALKGEVGFDLPVIVAVTFVFAAVIVVLNLLVDLLHPVVDPRQRGGVRSA